MRRAGHVERVVRAERLRQNVADAGQLDDRAHRATGDDTRTRSRRAQQYPCATVLDLALVPDRRSRKGHVDPALARALDALADRVRHLAGLAEPDTHAALAVADDNHAAEREAPAALDYLGHAVDLNHALFKFPGLFVASTRAPPVS